MLDIIVLTSDFYFGAVVKAHYGYSDGSGEYYLLIDGERCDGCGECAKACPEEIFEIARDDYGKMVAKVREEIRKRISYLCPGFKSCRSIRKINCHSVCPYDAIDHTW